MRSSQAQRQEHHDANKVIISLNARKNIIEAQRKYNNAKKEFYKISTQIRNYRDPDYDINSFVQTLTQMKELMRDADIIKKSSFFIYKNVKKMREAQKPRQKGGVRRSKNSSSIQSKISY